MFLCNDWRRIRGLLAPCGFAAFVIFVSLIAQVQRAAGYVLPLSNPANFSASLNADGYENTFLTGIQIFGCDNYVFQSKGSMNITIDASASFDGIAPAGSSCPRPTTAP